MLYDVSYIGLCFKGLRYRASSLSVPSFPSSKEGLGSLLRLILLDRVVCQVERRWDQALTFSLLLPRLSTCFP